MNLLLDTATALWLASDDSRLSVPARVAYEDPVNVTFVSVVSIWEILVKNKVGKLPLTKPIDDLLDTMKSDGVQILQLKESAVMRVAGLPELHRDPFDRILICQALDERLTIVTPDHLIKDHPINTIW
ncbi:MAG TPA: type II toxin-antitoxin system VapC family toxin [Tepidisphaeraceae bacterium]|jgi:PIN domain nuclease of toxin-antitoxin system|nr:type II toxin-antitoxin system VapC family toxin [Tepidisphaeraceae bacterium]